MTGFSPLPLLTFPERGSQQGPAESITGGHAGHGPNCKPGSGLASKAPWSLLGLRPRTLEANCPGLSPKLVPALSLTLEELFI